MAQGGGLCAETWGPGGGLGMAHRGHCWAGQRAPWPASLWRGPAWRVHVTQLWPTAHVHAHSTKHIHEESCNMSRLMGGMACVQPHSDRSRRVRHAVCSQPQRHRQVCDHPHRIVGGMPCVFTHTVTEAGVWAVCVYYHPQ